MSWVASCKAAELAKPATNSTPRPMNATNAMLMTSVFGRAIALVFTFIFNSLPSSPTALFGFTHGRSPGSRVSARHPLPSLRQWLRVGALRIQSRGRLWIGAPYFGQPDHIPISSPWALPKPGNRDLSFGGERQSGQGHLRHLSRSFPTKSPILERTHQKVNAPK